MYLLGDPHPALQVEFNSDVDFLVQCLLYDGLRVTPFDAHPAGTGRLQAAGLNVAMWQDWAREVVLAKSAVRRLARSREKDLASQIEFDRAAWVSRDVIAACSGASGELVEALRETYEVQQRGEPNDLAGLRSPPDRIYEEIDAIAWQRLEPYIRQLEGLWIYQVRYPVSTTMPVKPVVGIIASGMPESS